MDEVTLAEYKKTKLEKEKRRRHQHKKRFESILEIDLDERIKEENGIFWHYVFVRVCQKRRGRRCVFLKALLRKTNEYSSSRFNSNLFMTGYRTGEEFLDY